MTAGEVQKREYICVNCVTLLNRNTVYNNMKVLIVIYYYILQKYKDYTIIYKYFFMCD